MSAWSSGEASSPVSDLRAAMDKLKNEPYRPSPPVMMNRRMHDISLRWLKAYGIVASGATRFTQTDMWDLYWASRSMREFYPLALGEGQDEQYDVFV